LSVDVEQLLDLPELALPWPVLVLLGLSIGALQGFFGVGGGWLTTPALNVLGFPIVYAIGTDLAFTATSAMVGSARHYRLGNLDIRLALALGTSGMLGVEMARRVVLGLEQVGMAELAIRGAYIALLAGVGGSIVLEYVRGRRRHIGPEASVSPEAEPTTRLARRFQNLATPPRLPLTSVPLTYSIWVLAGLGLLVGSVSGLLGVGGGFIMVPMLVYVLGLPTRVAVASSLFSIVLSGTYGAFAYGAAGRVNLGVAALLFAGAIIGVQVGALATLRAPARAMRVLLGATLLLAAAAVVLQQLQIRTVSLAIMFITALAMTAAILGYFVRGRFPRPTTPAHVS
jgi:uncharacterized membrane protein YfcA